MKERIAAAKSGCANHHLRGLRLSDALHCGGRRFGGRRRAESQARLSIMRKEKSRSRLSGVRSRLAAALLRRAGDAPRGFLSPIGSPGLSPLSRARWFRAYFAARRRFRRRFAWIRCLRLLAACVGPAPVARGWAFPWAIRWAWASVFARLPPGCGEASFPR
jgi:hypothetical protein